MFKALWYGVKIAALIAAAVWVADRPGRVQIEWLDYTLTVQVGFFLLALLGFVLLTLFVYQTIRTFVDFPKSYRRYLEIKNREKGWKALTAGLTAVAAGDTAAALRQAEKAEKLIPEDQGLRLLLHAQAARLDGREDDAARCFVALLDNKDAAFLGVRGLLRGALDNADYSTASELARKALEKHPRQNWILKIAYDLEVRLRHWPQAMSILKRGAKYGAFTHEKLISDQIAMLVLQAEEAGSNKAQTLDYLKQAVKLDRGFAPAAQRLARFYMAGGQSRKAKAVIEKAWKTRPHPSLLKIWGALQNSKKAQDAFLRLQWFERLLKFNAQTGMGQREIGRLAMEAGLWGEAREYLKRAEALEPDAPLYQLWAELEERAGNNPAVVKDKRQKAGMAPAGKVWVCRESGKIYEDWSPIAMPHGSFNTIIWDEPSIALQVEPSWLRDRSGMVEALIEAPAA